MAPRARLHLGDHVSPPEGSAEVQQDQLGIARTQLQSAAAVGNSGHRGARPGSALSPTARVMNATWMNSDSQLSTYMNHMAPPGRRDGPARSGSRDTERPLPCCPRPTDTERSGAEHRRPCAPRQARERRQLARRIELALHPPREPTQSPGYWNQTWPSTPAPHSHGSDFSGRGKLPYLRSHNRNPHSPEFRMPLNGRLQS